MAENRTSITLPEGMTESDFMKAFESFQKSRVATAKRDKATRAAQKRLIDAHKPEYQKYLDDEIKKAG